jgi:Rrf2 family protein
VQARDLAKQEELPSKFLESILLALRRGGFLESKVGSGGGYRLSRAPREIIVGDVLRRLEGRLSARDTEARREFVPGELAVRLVNQRLTEATDKVLDNITLEELLDEISKQAGSHQEMYYI